MKFPSYLTTAESIYNQLIRADPATALSVAQSQFDNFFAYVNEVVPQASTYIEGETGRSWVPYKEDKTLYFVDIEQGGQYDFRRKLLWLPDDLMVLSSITWDGTVLAATDYRLHPTDNASVWAIVFNPSSSLAWSSDFNDGIVISGIWGYHESLSQAWTTVSASVTIADASTTSITVAASNLYETWQYIRCEAEYMQITAKPTATTLTVVRGVNGTTAAAHTAQALQTFMPVKDIRMAATRLAAYLYQKRLDVGGSVQIGDAAFLLDSLPKTVVETINRRRKLTWGHV